MNVIELVLFEMANIQERIMVNFPSHLDKVKVLKDRQINRFSTKYIDILHNTPIYIRENLTSKSNKLLKEARDFRKEFKLLACLDKQWDYFLTQK